MTPIEVCITVDTELDINRSLRWPDLYEPIGLASLRREHQGRSHGLGLILDTLERWGLCGTFFLETMNTHYFGDGPMAGVAAEIRSRGHDLQLHLHPCWGYLRGRKAGTVPDDGYTDSIRDFSGEALRGLLADGRDTFARLTGAPPLAFRSGSLIAHRGLFPALAATGLRLSSTLAMGVYEPAEPELKVTGGRCRIDGVTELPVLAYRSPKASRGASYKAATLIGSSWRELKGLLDQAAREDSGPFVILTHASEFSGKSGTPAAPLYLPWPRMQRRFDSLCRYLHEHPERFRTVTFSERYEAWTSAPLPAKAPGTLSSGLLGLGSRLIENNLLPRLGLH
jgi:hypothetical protein